MKPLKRSQIPLKPQCRQGKSHEWTRSLPQFCKNCGVLLGALDLYRSLAPGGKIDLPTGGKI